MRRTEHRADGDRFSDSDSESSSGSEYSDSASESSDTESNPPEGGYPEIESPRNHKRIEDVSRASAEHLMPIVSQQTNSEYNRNSIADAALQKLQSLRERRRSSILGVKDANNGPSGSESGVNCANAAETQSNGATLWPQIPSSRSDRSAAAVANSAESHSIPTEVTPNHPLVDSIALPSTSAWIVDQNGNSHNGQRSASGIKMSQDLSADAAAKQCSNQQTSSDKPSMSPAVCSSNVGHVHLCLDQKDFCSD